MALRLFGGEQEPWHPGILWNFFCLGGGGGLAEEGWKCLETLVCSGGLCCLH